MQGAQTSGSRFRGIGVYTTNFVKALLKNNNQHEIILLLSDRFPEAISCIRKEFASYIDNKNIVVMPICENVKYIEPNSHTLRKTSEIIREAFIDSLNPDVVLITSLFEGFIDDAVTGIGVYKKLPTAVILYDLIPLINKEIYLSFDKIEKWYFSRIDHLKRADLLLSISESSGKEAVDYLDFSPENVVPIGTDCDERFKKINLKVQDYKYFSKKYGIEKSFIMYTGGADHRKNLEALIRAFALLPVSLRKKHQLAIVCNINEEYRNRLLSLAKDVGLNTKELILTGYVSDDDLLLLYNACELFVFPSWHEGFGLPVLEAMRCGKPVMTSNRSSLPEVVGLEEAMFDPFNIDEISHCLQKALTDDIFRKKLIENSLHQSKKFSWDKTAQKALNAIESKFKKGVKPSANICYNKRPKMAYISPLPPEKSGISDYSSIILRHLSKWYDIDVVVNQNMVSDNYVIANFNVLNKDQFLQKHFEYDRVLYHMGNSMFHAHMFELLEKVPGVVVLHDFYLSGILSYLDSHRIVPDIWIKSLYHSHGYKSLYELFNTSNYDDIVWNYPSNLRVLQNALNIIVHSRYSVELADRWYGWSVSKDWKVIPLAREKNISIKRADARKMLGFSDEDIVITTFGFIGPTKLSQEVLDAFIGVLNREPNKKMFLIFVGENHSGEYGKNLQSTIDNHKLHNRVKIAGWVDSDKYCQYLAASDISVQLRTNSRGETSASLLDCLSFGVATITNANGSNGYVDRECLLMLPDQFTIDELTNAIVTLVNNSELRKNIGKRAENMVNTLHSPSACAKLYFEFIEQTYNNPIKKLPGLLKRLRSENLDNKDLLSISKSVATNFPPVPRLRQVLIDISSSPSLSPSLTPSLSYSLPNLILTPPDGWRAEPVIVDNNGRYVYARKFTTELLKINSNILNDKPIDFATDDILIIFDADLSTLDKQSELIEKMQNYGIDVWFFILELKKNDNILKFKKIFDASKGVISLTDTVIDDLKNILNIDDQTKFIKISHEDISSLQNLILKLYNNTL
jgi:glycosyltransferase involved in cell wall biosynthesis